jgi:hypothetical protein
MSDTSNKAWTEEAGSDASLNIGVLMLTVRKFTEVDYVWSVRLMSNRPIVSGSAVNQDQAKADAVTAAKAILSRAQKLLGDK